ncbi:hypothetical protein WR25_05515 [Diploscapter pachys]|uniref:Uncharacterized protein n=1 Tax=Diploscapter pachys TaxID=2018661 RepID=A0A2A2M276_9BILA|nr:hypothetical protein WR25_05515 [Diploscapter pachys]
MRSVDCRFRSSIQCDHPGLQHMAEGDFRRLLTPAIEIRNTWAPDEPYGFINLNALMTLEIGKRDRPYDRQQRIETHLRRAVIDLAAIGPEQWPVSLHQSKSSTAHALGQRFATLGRVDHLLGIEVANLGGNSDGHRLSPRWAIDGINRIKVDDVALACTKLDVTRGETAFAATGSQRIHRGPAPTQRVLARRQAQRLLACNIENRPAPGPFEQLVIDMGGQQ